MLEKDKELILVAVNAVGDLFEAVIGNEVINEHMEQTNFGASFGDTSFDMFDYENPFHNCSYSEKEKTFIQNTSIQRFIENLVNFLRTSELKYFG